jgi:hypothetical protein
VSQWLREYQLTGKVPKVNEPMLPFWAGWLMGTPTASAITMSEKLEMAEFIEEQK